jgi:putative flippase GtrA
MTTRILKTGLAGIAGTLIDIIALIVLVEVAGVAVGWAAFLAASAGAVVVFTLSKLWAFRDRSPLAARQVGAFAFVSLVNATFMAFAVHLMAIVMGMAYLIAKGLSAVLVFACWSYPAQSRIVFSRAAEMRASATHRIQLR